MIMGNETQKERVPFHECSDKAVSHQDKVSMQHNSSPYLEIFSFNLSLQTVHSYTQVHIPTNN